MSYQILTKETVGDFLINVPAIRDFLATNDSKAIETKEIGDGNLNLVFVVNHQQQSLIVKQALPYLRCVGESYPLAKERMHYEIRALQKFSQFSPAHTPKLYYTDEAMCLAVMQNLDEHIIMRKGMIQGIEYPKFADHISSFLAESLFKTSSLFIDSTAKTKLIADFNQNELRKLTENFVFTYPFMSHETNHIRPEMLETAAALWSNLEFKMNVLRLKDLFMNKTDALLHGDLHTGSVMANQNETYVIDPEFAFVGPFGFDLGAMLANLLMSWISHGEYSQNKSYQHHVFHIIRDFWQLFTEKFLTLWQQHSASPLIENNFMSAQQLAFYQNEFMRKMLQEMVGFAGCKIARRQLGLAGVEDIRAIPDIEIAVRAEKRALTIATKFVIQHQNFMTLDDVMKCLISEV